MPNDHRPITLITGATGALGGALCEHLLQRGHRVLAIVSPEQPHVERVRALARDGSAISVHELAEPSTLAWAKLMQQVVGAFGPPSGAVLAAGAYAGGAPLSESSDVAWRLMLEANLETARMALQSLSGVLAAARRGSVVLVGSRAAERPWEAAGAAAYAVSKAGLLALVRAVAAELLDARVCVNAVLPSVLDTAQNRAAMPDADQTRWVALGSLCGVIEFLLSDAARDISGAAVPVYGRVGV